MPPDLSIIQKNKESHKTIKTLNDNPKYLKKDNLNKSQSKKTNKRSKLRTPSKRKTKTNIP